MRLQQRQARETGICPVRRELYSQCFGMTLFFLHHFYLMITQPGDYFFANFNEKIVFVDLPKFGHQQEIESPDFNSYPKIFLLVS